MTLGEQIEIDSATRVILGQPLDMAAQQPDVANVVVHRTGDVLVIVDTGATPIARDAIRSVADDLAPWSEILLLTTHGHVDHVANNDVIMELGADLDPSRVRHFVSAHDAGQYDDGGLDYWTTNLRQLAGIVPGFDDPAQSARDLLAMFQPLAAVTDVTRTFEALPLEHLRIGPLHLSGWSFHDGAVRVIRTHGHCAGHVVVHLAEARLLHLSDEPNGPCGAMHDADQLNIFTAMADALTLVESDSVDAVTEGHVFAVHDHHAAVDRLTGMLDAVASLDRGIQPILTDGVDDVAAFADAMVSVYDGLELQGGNPNAMFTTMMALSKLRELGMVSEGHGPGQRWSRPALR